MHFELKCDMIDLSMANKIKNEVTNMIERLSGDYNRGYTKAIMDIQKIFEYVKDDLHFHHKRMNEKMADELLKCCLENRENLRESIPEIGDGFIRWNPKLNTFEFYKPKRQTK